MMPFYEYKTELLQCSKSNFIDFPPHLHVSLELLYVSEGEILTGIGDREYSVKSGELAIIFPNTVHSYKTVSSKDNTDFTMLIYNHTLAEDYKNILNTCLPTVPIISSENLHKDVTYIVSSLLEENSDAATALYIQLILERTLPYLTLAQNKEPITADLTASIIDYILRHYQEKITLNNLSKKFLVSRYNISRLFSNTIGTGLTDYINTLRINHAQKLLLNRKIKILSVALDSGFDNQQTFNRVFKKHCGITPKEYRNKNT